MQLHDAGISHAFGHWHARLSKLRGFLRWNNSTENKGAEQPSRAKQPSSAPHDALLLWFEFTIFSDPLEHRKMSETDQDAASFRNDWRMGLKRSVARTPGSNKHMASRVFTRLANGAIGKSWAGSGFEALNLSAGSVCDFGQLHHCGCNFL
jgi:hypothetical protein